MFPSEQCKRLVEVEQQEKEKKRLRALGKLKPTMLDELYGYGAQEEEPFHDDTNKKVFNDGPSVALWCFMKYTNSLSDKFLKVQLRLISAFGIDVNNENMRINWH